MTTNTEQVVSISDPEVFLQQLAEILHVGQTIQWLTNGWLITSRILELDGLITVRSHLSPQPVDITKKVVVGFKVGGTMHRLTHRYGLTAPGFQNPSKEPFWKYREALWAAVIGHQSLVIVGPSGIGKVTVARQVLAAESIGDVWAENTGNGDGQLIWNHKGKMVKWEFKTGPNLLVIP